MTIETVKTLQFKCPNKVDIHSIFKRSLLLLLIAFSISTVSETPAIAAGKIINVKAAPYFAKGDGVTDDSAAIQAAIDAAGATPGNTVLFPSGTYLHNSPLIVNGLRTSLKGLNRANTILTGGGITFNSDGANLFGLNFKYPNVYIISRSNKSLFSNCTFDAIVEIASCSDVQVSSCDFNFTSSGYLYFNNSTRVSLIASRLKSNINFYAALYTYYSSDVVIKQSTIVSTSGYGISALLDNRLLVENCNISDVGAGYYNYLGQSNINVTLRSNVFGSPSQNPSIYGGIYSDYETNVLINNNQIQRVATGVRLTNGASITISGNRISQTNSDGIYVASGANNQTILSGNILKNCGLTSATAAIFADDSYGNFIPIIKGNIYTGNQQNIQYFIRCEMPSPPSVVQGNITTTMLPTLVGP